jgi:hypothetical protein
MNKNYSVIGDFNSIKTFCETYDDLYSHVFTRFGLIAVASDHFRRIRSSCMSSLPLRSKVERQWDHFNGANSANADQLFVWTLQGTRMLRCDKIPVFIARSRPMVNACMNGWLRNAVCTMSPESLAFLHGP